MLIVKIKAGLGNQMFQYAFGRALSLERKEKLFLDISYYQNQPKQDAKRAYILDAFAIQADTAPEELSREFNTKFKVFLRKIYRRIRKMNDYAFYPSLLRSRSSYYEGTWINEKYFAKYADTIRNELSLKDPFGDAAKKTLLELSVCKSNNEESVSLHIRRGDFVSSPQAAFNGVLGVPYYQKATDVLMSHYHKKNIHVFVFSDDIGWAKENLKLPCPIFFVSHPDIADYEEVILMSKCDHHIIANSTFSWWGAWLNPNKNKIVIATKQWLKDKTTDELDMPKAWIRI